LVQLPGSLADDLERALASIAAEDCGECWEAKTFPRFRFALDRSYVVVEVAGGIKGTLQSRHYRFSRAGCHWTKRFQRKAEYLKELKWIRARGFNVQGAERRADGRASAVDLRQRS
jgi:hypothetical protein